MNIGLHWYLQRVWRTNEIYAIENEIIPYEMFEFSGMSNSKLT